MGKLKKNERVRSVYMSGMEWELYKIKAGMRKVKLENVYGADKSTKFCTEVGFIVYIMQFTGSKIFGKYFGVYGRATFKQTRKF